VVVPLGLVDVILLVLREYFFIYLSYLIVLSYLRGGAAGNVRSKCIDMYDLTADPIAEI
jgi:hypothetical protein